VGSIANLETWHITFFSVNFGQVINSQKRSRFCKTNLLLLFMQVCHRFVYAVYSLYTTLPLEWEPDLIAISVLYMSCRLLKFKVTSWVDKPDNYTGKWYTFFVNDVNLDIIESKFQAICWYSCVSFFLSNNWFITIQLLILCSLVFECLFLWD